MSFHSYLKNIELKTGKAPEDFINLATKKQFMEHGLLKPTIKASEVIQWLKEEYLLGHGHAMAMHAYLKSKRE